MTKKKLCQITEIELIFVKGNVEEVTLTNKQGYHKI